MTDRELLELAAKAMQNSGNPNFANFKTMEDGKSVCLDIGHRRGAITSYWRPMYDDGDALRLALHLRINIEHVETSSRKPHGVNCWPVGRGDCSKFETALPDYNAATRRAIVRAAAEIGKEMK